jgi:predicted DsbA family dithiol-disulfide isomerase
MRALRLTELARDRDLHASLHDRLMQAYWAEGDDIGDRAVLLALAEEAGLDAAEAGQVLDGEEYRDRVHRSTAQAQSIGITGIPAFLVDRRQLILGAQPRDVFETVLERLGHAPR